MQDLKLNKIANQQRKLLYVNWVLFSHLKAFVNLHFACGFKDLNIQSIAIDCMVNTDGWIVCMTRLLKQIGCLLIHSIINDKIKIETEITVKPTCHQACTSLVGFPRRCFYLQKIKEKQECSKILCLRLQRGKNLNISAYVYTAGQDMLVYSCTLR